MTANCGCGGTCGCCEGVEPVTPVAIANPPGLDAVRYRVGTHGRFLETMLSRLSQGPLAALRTRDRDDASVALLDAWATVADILSFYQERIANEGYLGTATERRSVLELGRLVGYRLRPGVAATTYLAYTLEADARVTIESGSKVQSVPAPGELPQTFETVESAPARGEWNVLAVRAGRPPDAARVRARAAAAQVLHFEGITTGLAPNDPLLLDLGPEQQLARVLTVEADSTTNRTQITIEPWRTAAATPVATTIAGLRAALDELLDQGAPDRGSLERDAAAELERLRTNLLLGAADDEVRELAAELLPTLRRERFAGGPNDAWLARAVDTLQRVAGSAPPPTSIGGALDSLATPPSIQPASPRDLRTGPETTFGPASTAVPNLLTAMRPELAGVLYDAWRHLESTPPSPLVVYALKLRASPFGHAAPPEPVKDKDGVVIGTREWTLLRGSSITTPEPFEVLLTIPQNRFGSPPPVVIVVVRVGAARAEATVTLEELLTDGFTLEIEDAGERLQIGLTLPEDSPPTPGVLDLAFARHGSTFRATLAPSTFQSVQASLEWSSTGSDPTRVRFAADREPVINLAVAAVAFGQPMWRLALTGFHAAGGQEPTEDPFVVSLDTTYPTIVPGSWVVVDRPPRGGSPPDLDLVISPVAAVRDVSRADYGITGRSTQVTIQKPWLELGEGGDTFAVIRGSAVYAQSEALPLVDEPIEDPVCGGEIELDRIYDGLEAGRWVIVSGERADVVSSPADPVGGVRAAEVAMLAAVRHEVDLGEPSARTRSTLVLAAPLAYCYRRDTLTIHANVLKASHGETRQEVLGSGDGSVGGQAFPLRQKPLTYVPAVTPTGVAGTLDVQVDGVRWHEAESPVGLAPTDRAWIASTGDDDVTTVTFGNGTEGARLPTGLENVTAVYRFGLGRVGNVAAGSLTLLATRPTGVKEVTNPQPASGGADREERDQARRNIPLAVTALDRIVSVQDHADFARTFAGIGKAAAVRLAGGVHVTIAGEDDIPILPTSDLFRTLRIALAEFGNPFDPLTLAVRTLRVLVIVANVAIDDDHLWERVEPALRAALADRFGFDHRDLAQDVAMSEVLSAMQAVPGVLYVDVDILDALDEAQVTAELTTPTAAGLAGLLGRRERLRAAPAHVDAAGAVQPAELIALRPDLPQTLSLLKVP